MNFEEASNYIKVVLLIMNGGTFILRRLIHKVVNESKRTLDNFLSQSEEQLRKKLNTKQTELVFPGQGQTRDINEWDISLLTLVLLEVFQGYFNGQDILSIKEIRDQRNKIIGHKPNAVMNQKEFNSHWYMTLRELKCLAVLLPAEDQKDLNDIETSIYHTQLIQDLIEQSDEIKELESSGVKERIMQLCAKEISENENLKELLYGRLLDIMKDNEQNKEHEIGITLRLSVKTGNRQSRKCAQQSILEASNQVISKDGNTDDDMVSATKRLFSEIENLDVKIIKVDEGSILLKVRCSTRKSIYDMIHYLTGPIVTDTLLCLETAVNKTCSCRAKITLNVDLDSLEKAISTLEKEMNTDVVYLTLGNGRSSVTKSVRYFESSEFLKNLNDLSEAVTNKIGEKVEICAEIVNEKLESETSKTCQLFEESPPSSPMKRGQYSSPRRDSSTRDSRGEAVTSSSRGRSRSRSGSGERARGIEGPVQKADESTVDLLSERDKSMEAIDKLTKTPKSQFPQKTMAKNPRLQANMISKLFFLWLSPIFAIAPKRRLEQDDMFDISDDERSKNLGDKLERAWSKQVESCRKTKTKPKLYLSLISVFWKPFVSYGFLLFFEETVVIIQPLLLSGLIRYFTKSAPFVSETEGYLYAGGIGMCALILAFTHHIYYLGVQTIGVKMKIACSSLIYRQTLRLSSEGRREMNTGYIFDLFSSHVSNFIQLMTMLHFLWIGPLEIIAVLTILWYEIGPPAIAGFIVMFAMVPLVHWIGDLITKYEKFSAKYRENRICIITEIIRAIKVGKLYCWEKPFGERLRKERMLEVVEQKTVLFIHFVQDTLIFVSKFFNLLPVIILMTYLSIDLRASSVFLALRLYDHANLIVGRRMRRAYTSLVKTLDVNLEEIQKFLLLGKWMEITDTNIDPVNNAFVDINIKRAQWQDTGNVTLRNVSARVEQGKVLTIVGPVGCGKSTLLMAILNELKVIDGNIKVHGRVAYASQQPWLFSGSVKENITVGETNFDNDRYQQIIKACALDEDVEMISKDETLTGDRGVNLRGGQRSRVNLARALYCDAEIYLLDDPLSAVDSKTGQHIYKNVIQGLLKDKITILVTHQRQFIKLSDEVIFISKDGSTKTIGKEKLQTLSDSEMDGFSGLETENINRNHSRLDGAHEQMKQKEASFELDLCKINIAPKTPQKREKEKRREKTVKLSAYSEYLKAGASVPIHLFMIIAFFATQGLSVFGDAWLSIWADQEEKKYAAIMTKKKLLTEGFANVTDVTLPVVNTRVFLLIYGIIALIVIVCGLVRAKLFSEITLNASKNLYNSMLDSILATRMDFFENDSVTGQILNIFSRDVRQLDTALPKTFYEFLQCAFIVIGIIVVAGMAVPWVYIILVPLCLCFVICRSKYVKTSTQIRRLQRTTLSPIKGHATTTHEGIYTIRACKAQENMVKIYDNFQDDHIKPTLLSLSVGCWFAVRLDLLCAIFVIVVSFVCVAEGDGLDAGLVGLSITYTMSLMALFQWCVRQSTEVENRMVSVERALEYINLPPESTTGRIPYRDWPKTGGISFRGASLKYPGNDRPALEDLYFTIRDKEKVGIVGRTGAGKSSLITMLFRLVEPDGYISIDGEDIKEIDLHVLRKQIAIVPQDPVLFSESLRKNVDPFGDYQDEEIWNALHEVQLKEEIKRLDKGLDYRVSEGGSNFSVGQRQLICLARVLLLNRKIVIIDEATANVDNQTDAKIQGVIKGKFKNCTVLTIAHRLITVMDSHRILVLEERKATFGVPHLLLQDKDCSLLKMVEETGEMMASCLKKIAKEAYERQYERLPISDGFDNENAVTYASGKQRK